MPDSLNSQPRAGVAYASLGLPVTWTLQSLRGAWPLSGVEITLNGPTTITSFPPTRFDGDGMIAVWELTDVQVDALEGFTEWRVQIDDGWPLVAGPLVWLSGYAGLESPQSLGAVLMGSPGPGIESVAMAGNSLVFTLSDGTLLPAVAFPAHASRHATAGADPITPAAIGAATAAQGAKADTAIQPEDAGLTWLDTGEETMPRTSIAASATAASTGLLRLAYFTARKTETVTQVRMVTGGTAAAPTPTLCRIGVYSVDSSGDLTLVASIPNDTTLFASASTSYTRSFSAPFDKVRGARYAVGILVVSATTVPTIFGQSVGPGSEYSYPPRITGQVSGLSDLPDTVAAASVGATSVRFYSVLL